MPEPYHPITQRARRALRAAGMRVTTQRLAVYRVLAAHPHSGVDDIARAIRRELGTISTQAVYDVVNALCDGGLAQRVEPAGSPALYELRCGDNHHHAICISCGAVEDVDCDHGMNPCSLPVSGDAFTVLHTEVTYWGVCPECAAKSDTPPTMPLGGPRRKFS